MAAVNGALGSQKQAELLSQVDRISHTLAHGLQVCVPVGLHCVWLTTGGGGWGTKVK